MEHTRETIMQLIADKAAGKIVVVDLSRQDLSGLDLRCLDMRGANLQYANLQFANLRGANLQFANLRGADMQYANLRGADLDYAGLNLSCKTIGIICDKRLVSQLLYHLCRLDARDCPEWDELRNDDRVIALANQSHVIKTHNLPKIVKE